MYIFTRLNLKRERLRTITQDSTKRSTFIHVCASWTAGPRSAHPKFGGGIVIGGIPRVEDRLLAIKQRFSNVRSSGHNFLEIRLNGQYERHNSPTAISYGWLREGIRNEIFPLWSCFTNPAFGIAGVENGAILSDDPAIIDIGPSRPYHRYTTQSRL